MRFRDVTSSYHRLAESSGYLEKTAILGSIAKGVLGAGKSLGGKALRQSQKSQGKVMGPVTLGLGGVGMAGVTADSASKAKKWNRGFKALSRGRS